jgi:hypothetical protein
MSKIAKVFAAASAAALATAAIAVAKPHEPTEPGEHGHSGEHGHAGEHGGGPKTVSYVFKGAYVDATTVDVAKGNNHVKKAGLAGGPVSFDLSSAKIVVGDVDGDGSSDLADVAAGDKVVVKVRAPKGDPGSGPFVARQLVDQTSSDSGDETSDDEPTGDGEDEQEGAE